MVRSKGYLWVLKYWRLFLQDSGRQREVVPLNINFHFLSNSGFLITWSLSLFISLMFPLLFNTYIYIYKFKLFLNKDNSENVKIDRICFILVSNLDLFNHTFFLFSGNWSDFQARKSLLFKTFKCMLCHLEK